MKKYYRGLIVLALLTLGLTAWVISLGIGSRQDVKTEKRAQEIATDLNEWVAKEEKVPDSLNAAGIKNVPDTISYSKKDADSYEFCVTYKAAKDYGSEGGIVTPLITRAMSGVAADTSASMPIIEGYTNTALYFYGSHNKGKNCQTIKPYYYGKPIPASASDSPASTTETFPAPDSEASTIDLYEEYCSPDSVYYQYTKSYCESGGTTNMMAN